MPEKPNFYSQTEPPKRVQGPTIPLEDEEKQILIWVARGLSNQEISYKLGIAPTQFKRDKLSVITHKLLEKTKEDALSRVLMTKQIQISEVMPEGYPLKLRTEGVLQSGRITKVWAALAQNPGSIPQIAPLLNIGTETFRNYSMDVYAALEVEGRAEAIVIYYGALAEGLIPDEFEPAA